jgi:Glycosyltransferase family 87
MPAAVARLMPEGMLRATNRTLDFVRRPDVRRAILVLAVLLAIAAYARFMADIYRGDAYGYWYDMRQSPLYYTAPDTAPHGYLYSPAFIQAMWPLLSLPWEIFYGIWLGLLTITVLWLARPWLSLPIFALTFVTFGVALLAIPRHSLSSGNIYLFMGLAVVAGFRWPWTYAFLFLTKVTPGVGVLWFLVRREWKSLAIVVVATVAVVAVSFVINPGWWFDWITVLRNNAGYPEPDFAYHILPLAPRLAIAVVMVVVAAHFNARWVLPIATVLAMPYIADTALIILICVAPLARGDAWTLGRSRKPAGEAAAQGTVLSTAPAS